MSSSALISRVRFVPASSSTKRDGLLGWVSFATTDGLLVDGLALRTSRDGRPAFVWPARRDRAGRDHHVVRPLNDVARKAIEQQILSRLLRMSAQTEQSVITSPDIN